MPLFRKKPVVIEAVQFDGTLTHATELQDEDPSLAIEVRPDGVFICIHTLEGKMEALPGDWIITGVAGERYPCKPDIFEQTYEPADDAAAAYFTWG